jgi:hypothetical protein
MGGEDVSLLGTGGTSPRRPEAILILIIFIFIPSPHLSSLRTRTNESRRMGMKIIITTKIAHVFEDP